MYTEIVFEKSARQPVLEKYFKLKQTSGMTCELVDEKLVTV
jgi:hypothetical protein